MYHLEIFVQAAAKFLAFADIPVITAVTVTVKRSATSLLAMAQTVAAMTSATIMPMLAKVIFVQAAVKSATTAIKAVGTAPVTVLEDMINMPVMAVEAVLTILGIIINQVSPMERFVQAAAK